MGGLVYVSVRTITTTIQKVIYTNLSKMKFVSNCENVKSWGYYNRLQLDYAR